MGRRPWTRTRSAATSLRATQGDLVTTSGCPYEQQTDNILHHGMFLSAAGTSLTDGAGAAVGTAQYTCGRFVMAEDPHGVSIIVDGSSGQVRSHGSVHAGFPVSSLPPTLKTPLSF